ncbi:PREDICTED: probable pectate lyase 4 [Populus euphratica]|uniref:Pectate lyase n=1 Tax=Populus euphratica TaxID=75702 RepID=A0AAJ6XNF5_POPEU|nr:PREDICTED: probable pectate lyase 4 [Populus euphratica]
MVVLRHLLVVVVCIAILSFIPSACIAATKMNAIDQCWKTSPNWRRSRQQLASCSVGFAGKMTNNAGRDAVMYEVTDPSDDPVNPKQGTLRHGATMITSKVWITFERNMDIKLEKPLLISSYTAIDGRGVDVGIEGFGCFLVYKATDVIIHGLRIHHCNAQGPSTVMGPDGKQMQLGQMDGDAIRLVSASKVWIDHNTLYSCQDGLLDVTRGSTFVTVSNNWFRDQDKVMLLGHDDGFLRDKNMKVTVAFNRFGPNCNQRMPRIRHGYAHVANNLYRGWEQYAIGGSMSPSIKSESNYFIAPTSGKKEVTWRNGISGKSKPWNFYSIGDLFTNGASFFQTGRRGMAKPNYNKEQSFKVGDAKYVKALTSSAGALKCSRTSRC